MKALATQAAPDTHPHAAATGGSVQIAAVGKVLVLGQGTSSFLTVIRSLGRQKIEVHVGWCPSDCPARSRDTLPGATRFRPTRQTAIGSGN